MITVDGALGEGGGQIVRSSLSLAAVTGTPVRLVNIRAGRRRPGLPAQHLAALRAAAAVTGGRVAGDEPGSRTAELHPADIRPGDHSFAVGTAGSACLVLQTVLPPLLAAGGPSRVTLEGGTHNPAAPPFDFLEHSFLPALERMGPRVRGRLERPGFFPAGGGRMTFDIQPAGELRPLTLQERGEIREVRARVLYARLPRRIAERERDVLCDLLDVAPDAVTIEEATDSAGPGNVVLVEAACDHGTAVFTGFGMKRVRADDVAASAAAAFDAWRESGAPVDEHLADQLLLPLALAGGGAFRTSAPTPHTTTNAEVIRRFLPVDVTIEPVPGAPAQVEVRLQRT